MRQRRRFAAMLAALALAAGLTAIPALATEGGSPSTYTEIPGDGTGSVTDPLPIPDPGESAAPPSSQEPPSLLFPGAHGPAQLLLFARALAERSVGQRVLFLPGAQLLGRALGERAHLLGGPLGRGE